MKNWSNPTGYRVWSAARRATELVATWPAWKRGLSEPEAERRAEPAQERPSLERQD